MGLLDKAKQAVQGRSKMVEKGIDSAVAQVSKRTKGKYDETLEKRADSLKEQVRKVDTEPPAGSPDVPPDEPDDPTQGGSPS